MCGIVAAVSLTVCVSSLRPMVLSPGATWGEILLPRDRYTNDATPGQLRALQPTTFARLPFVDSQEESPRQAELCYAGARTR